MKPDRVFQFEPAEARALDWLPLAVRYKLDTCGLKIGLEEWQGLSRESREALLRAEAGAVFEMKVLELFPGARRKRGSAAPDPALAAAGRADLPPGGCPRGVDMWLHSASDFEVYLVHKILRWESPGGRRRALRELLPASLSRSH